MRLEEAKILVVDDEPDLREIFAQWLGRLGCTVLTAANGVDALKLLNTTKIDVLLSDVRMPVMSGVELVRNIFARKLMIPSIVFVSGYGDVEAREMYALGVEALMEKPLSRQDLLRVLEHSLMERDQLWLDPAPEPMAQRVAIEIASLKEATESCEFGLGRGGCCFFSENPLAEEKTVALSIQFATENLCLKAQGRVQWYEKAGQAGVSFSYLDPECREWVLASMRDGAYRSFIPDCRTCSRNASPLR